MAKRKPWPRVWHSDMKCFAVEIGLFALMLMGFKIGDRRKEKKMWIGCRDDYGISILSTVNVAIVFVRHYVSSKGREVLKPLYIFHHPCSRIINSGKDGWKKPPGVLKAVESLLCHKHHNEKSYGSWKMMLEYQQIDMNSLQLNWKHKGF